MRRYVESKAGDIVQAFVDGRWVNRLNVTDRLAPLATRMVNRPAEDGKFFRLVRNGSVLIRNETPRPEPKPARPQPVVAKPMYKAKAKKPRAKPDMWETKHRWFQS